MADSGPAVTERRENALEQVALRRVAALVAQGVQPQDLFAVVAEEVARVVGAPLVAVAHYESEEAATVCGTFPEQGTLYRTGERVSLDGVSVLGRIRADGDPARIDDYTDLEGAVAAAARTSGVRCGVGVPIVVGGRVWGSIVAWSTEQLPEDFEARLAAFTELLAAAIANAEASEAVALLANEQAALRRVATLVAQGVPPAELFSAVTKEVAHVFFGVEPELIVTVIRFDPGPECVLVGASRSYEREPIGSRWAPKDLYVSTRVLRTGRSAHVDEVDLESVGGPDAEVLRLRRFLYQVGSPVVVEGRLWGAMTLNSKQALPPDTDRRLENFTELVATAIANAQSRAEVERLAEEQAALRRVATLVARDALPGEVFDAVAMEVGKLLDTDITVVGRYDGDGAATAIGSWNASPGGVPVGTRSVLGGRNVLTLVAETGRPARLDGYDDATGEAAEIARRHGWRSSIAAPITVEGRVWGVMLVATKREQPFPAGSEEQLAQFTDLVATSIANTESRGALAQLADEQAALRRVATLVAGGTVPDQLFAAVADEVHELFGPVAAIQRHESDGSVLTVGAHDRRYVGHRSEITPGFILDSVRATKRAARFDTDDPMAPDMPAIVRETGARSVVASPIIVEGAVWGDLVAASLDRRLPAGIEVRLSEFTDLVATAIANVESQEARARVGVEQAALRRVATLVARDAPPGEVFDAVAMEVGKLLDTDITVVGRYDRDGAATAIGSWSASPGGVPVGTRSALGGRNVLTLVAETERPARLDAYGDASGEAAEIARSHGWRSSIAAPIIVEGRLWGVMLVATQRPESFPSGAEERLAAFTDLVATALANAQAHDEVRRFGDEQAALGRVATLVAGGAEPARVFTAVVDEVSGLLGLERIELVRYEADAIGTVIAASGDHPFPAGSSWSLKDPSVMAAVARTRRAARIDDYSNLDGEIARAARSAGFESAIGAPITVEGRLWGAIIAISTDPEPIPEQSEVRLGKFTGLVATAIANAQARRELRTFAEEQAALRRIATLVAQGLRPEKIFAAVTDEVAALFNSITAVQRFDHDGPAVVFAGVSKGVEGEIPIGTRWEFAEGMCSAEVYRTGRSARLDRVDWASRPGPAATAGGRLGIASQVGTPIIVDGSLWGSISVNAQEELPPDTEQRLEKFTGLVATAIANAESQSELAASRRRIVAASDETRRQIERDLHDGTQQRLVSLGLAVRAAEANLPSERDDLRAQLSGVATGLVAAVEDLQEISRGIHPAILSKGGLGPALKALAHRSAIPVDLDIRTDARFAEPIEVAAYFVASEALANAVKHSQASRVDMALEERDRSVLLTVRDDGVGGADTGRGSGLVGLTDRVEALGGSIRVYSRPGKGTQIAAELPLELEVAQPVG